MQTTYADRVRSNFVFSVEAKARPVQLYLDLKRHVVYPADVVVRVIRSVGANQGKSSNVLAKEVTLLAEPDVWGAIVQAVLRAIDGMPSKFVASKYRTGM